MSSNLQTIRGVVAAASKNDDPRPIISERLRHGNAAFVYAIQGGHSIKIGVTSRVDMRFSELQTGNPHRLVIRRLVGFRNRSLAMEFERLAHHHFAVFARRLSGEWFEATRTLMNMVDLWPDLVLDPIDDEYWADWLTIIGSHLLNTQVPAPDDAVLGMANPSGYDLLMPMADDDRRMGLFDDDEVSWTGLLDGISYSDGLHHFSAVAALSDNFIRVCRPHETQCLIGLDALPAHVRLATALRDDWERGET